MAGGRKSKETKKELTPEEQLERALVPVGEQPYKIPRNWCWTRLGSITEVVGGGTPSSKVEEYYKNGNIPWISPGDLSGYNDIYISRGAKNITKRGLEKSSAQLMPSGTVCLSSRAPIGYVVIAKNELCTNQGFKSFLPAPCYIPEYLYWYLKGNKELLESYASGTTFLELSGSKASLVEFPLAPLAEQRRIVDHIESLFVRLDEAREKAQAVVDGFELRKSAILHKAFTGELTERWRREHGITLKKWSKKKLKDCGDWFGGGTPSMAHPEYWNGGNLLWVTSKDMKFDVIEDTLMHTNMLGVNNSSANYIKKPSVLFVMRSGILRRTLPIAMVKVPFTVNQDLKAVSPTVDLNLEYLFWACKSSEKIIRNTCMKNGTTVESINAKALMEFEIPIVPQEEQIEIVNCIVSILEKEQQVKEVAETVLDQIETMKKAILARAFRGELGTNDPAEESAVEMLKAIL
ncbi:MAG: restriction endonuclease subunit S [Lachnospiraceae bacterium]|nr:restriction endonuclease subunit S [Lachnospiraceae bacterium]